MKFGGSSLASADTIEKVVEIIQKEERSKVVVVSAMSKVTDSLMDISFRIIDLPASVVEEEATDFVEKLRKRHAQAAQHLLKEDETLLKETISEIGELTDELETVLLGVGYLEELSPKSLDFILSFGERLSSALVSASLRASGIESRPMTGYEAGLVTNSNFGRAKPLFSEISSLSPERFNPLLEAGITPVVTGFIAANREGMTTTMGRGGSDFTASLLGRYLDAQEVQIWTDVDGILTTDPRVVPEARLIPTLSYVEAVDLAYFGAKVIHSKMIEPAMEVDIPVLIKNTFHPEGQGTRVVREQEKIDSVIKAVTIQRNVGIINLKGVGMVETPNVTGKLFTRLGDMDINILMISGSSESNLSFVVEDEVLSDAVQSLSNGSFGKELRELEVIDDVCIITVVGVGMRGTEGLASEVFKVIADEGVNIIMIAQGSSEVNISFMVKQEDGDKVLKALHEHFIE